MNTKIACFLLIFCGFFLKTIQAQELQARHQGIASWYSAADPSIHPFTASGEAFDDTKPTCASWDFPFGTYLKVVNLANGKSVVCRVNDRGPNPSLKRTIDLTKSSFKKIADTRQGLIQVAVIPLL